MPTDREHHARTRLITLVATVFVTGFVGMIGWSFKEVFDARERDIADLQQRIERMENRLYELSSYVPRTYDEERWRDRK